MERIRWLCPGHLGVAPTWLAGVMFKQEAFLFKKKKML
jgi:hypothetical protein